MGENMLLLFQVSVVSNEFHVTLTCFPSDTLNMNISFIILSVKIDKTNLLIIKYRKAGKIKIFKSSLKLEFFFLNQHFQFSQIHYPSSLFSNLF